MNIKPLLRLSLGFLSGVISWFVGWLSYSYFDLWAFIKPAEFQNILIVALGSSTLIGAMFAHRALKSVIQSPETNVIEVKKKLKFELSDKYVTLEEFYDLVDDLNKNIKDLKPFLPILQKRKEADA